MKRLLFTLTLTLLFFPVLAVDARERSAFDNLKDRQASIVRDSIIARGIESCRDKNHRKTVFFLKTFLNWRRVIATPVEKKAYICLALAYQSLGEAEVASKVVEGTLKRFHNSPVERANFEYTAGMVAYRQNRMIKAIEHWEAARQLYRTHNLPKAWRRTTFNLVNSYRQLRQLDKQRELLQQLKGVW